MPAVFSLPGNSVFLTHVSVSSTKNVAKIFKSSFTVFVGIPHQTARQVRKLQKIP